MPVARQSGDYTMLSLTKLMSMSNREVKDVMEGVDASQIQGRALRRRFQAIRSKKQGGFTLLELLVVVAILAILGGLAIGALGDKSSSAAKGGATNTIAAVGLAIQGYQATAKVLPNSVDTLVCAGPATATAGAQAVADALAYGGTSDLPGIGGGIGKKLAGKMALTLVPAKGVDALINAGITQLRYGAHVSVTESSCDATGDGGFTVAGVDYPNSPLADADIPNRGFDLPVGTIAADNLKNRGRGFVRDLAVIAASATATADKPSVLQVWKRGANGADNLKLGASAADVLVAVGIGNNASLVTDPENRTLNSSPFYGDVGKDKYGRYVALLSLGTDTDGDLATVTDQKFHLKSKFVAVVDARGDFLDEEFAEATGQKL